jgi:hypothetical protein
MSSDRAIPIIGVSLGHRHERTAISVTERAYVPTGEAFNAIAYDYRYKRNRLEAREGVRVEYRVRHLERQGPPSRYKKVAERLPEIVRELGSGEVLLVVDITATGRPVFALIHSVLAPALKETGTHLTYGPITVSGVAGGVSKSPDVGHLVPRRDLISAAQILFDEGQLKIAEGLSLAGTLRDELLAFKPKQAKPDDLEGWREGKDDDLVLAVATGVWSAERFMRKQDSVPLGGTGYPWAASAG